ncbi:MAG: lytic transglycosylase domain-containing protein [Alphaproteobacteria bacterium]
MKRLAIAAISCGLCTGWTVAATADDWDSTESFADIAGYQSPGVDAAQLASVPGYGALQVARVDPTLVLPEDGGPAANLERPLGLMDAQLYQQIFAAQEGGNLAVADGLIQQLTDRLLIGTVLHQRYMHPTAYRSSYDELAEWLRLYHDHAGAGDIYNLAVNRQPGGAAAPTPPSTDDSMSNFTGDPANRPVPLPIDLVRDSAGDRAARSAMSEIRRALRDEDRAGALAILAGNRGVLATAEAAEARGLVAFNAFLNGIDAESLEQAAIAVAEAGSAATDALWGGGLSAWRTGDYARAHQWFDTLSLSPHATRWTRTAAAFWGARSALRARQPGEVSSLLRRAAQHPDTFYGMLAQHALGMHDPRNWQQAGIGEEAIRTVLALPGTRRALALLQIGQDARSSAEFRALSSTLGGSDMQALLAYAERAELAELALRLSIAHAVRGGQPVWTARYPAPQWLPANGLQIDRAVMLAIMRQESAFNATAVSSAGARGLMQLMPRTASAMADRISRPLGDLSDPGMNMALGQQFVQELRSYSWIGDDILKIVVAYNGGPGNLQRWMANANYGDDPLLFIEAIRAGETRDYVERVMANLWAYRLRFGQPTPELDDLLAGRWPRYQNLNARTGVAALPH